MHTATLRLDVRLRGHRQGNPINQQNPPPQPKNQELPEHDRRRLLAKRQNLPSIQLKIQIVRLVRSHDDRRYDAPQRPRRPRLKTADDDSLAAQTPLSQLHPIQRGQLRPAQRIPKAKVRKDEQYADYED